MTWTPAETRLARSIYANWFPRDADRFDAVLPCGTMPAVTALAHKAARTALAEIRNDFIAAAQQ